MASSGLVVVCLLERHLQRLVETNMRRQGYKVSVAASGQDVLDKMAALPRIEHFILDPRLKSPDTQELTQRISADSKHSQARVFVFSLDRGDDVGLKP